MIWVVHPGSGYWIRILTFYPSRIPDPGIEKAPDPGSGSATLSKRLQCEEDSFLKKTQVSWLILIEYMNNTVFSADDWR